MSYFVLSKRGAKKLVDCNNYIYNCERKPESKWIWKCEVFTCPARVHKKVDNVEEVKRLHEHNHLQETGKSEVLKIKAKLKQKAKTSVESSQNVIADSISSLSEAVFASLPCSRNLIQTISREHRKALNFPQTPQNGSFIIPDEYQKTADGCNFIAFDSGKDIKLVHSSKIHDDFHA
jgi:hypothetical protein